MINKHKSNKIKENSNTVRHLNNGTDHRHSKSCCDQSSPARRTITGVNVHLEFSIQSNAIESFLTGPCCILDVLQLTVNRVFYELQILVWYCTVRTLSFYQDLIVDVLARADVHECVSKRHIHQCFVCPVSILWFLIDCRTPSWYISETE